MNSTVVKRGSKWAVVVDIGKDPDGKRIRKWHSGYATKREADKARAQILSRLHSET